MSRSQDIRLAELLGALSLAVDLGLGQPQGHVARAAMGAGRLADRMGLDAAERQSVFHVALLGWVGCIADSRESAIWFGDDIEYRAGVYDLDLKPLPFLGYLLRRAGSEDPLPRRTLKRAGVLLDGGRRVQRSLRSHCQVTAHVAGRLGLGADVCAALPQIFARWDGKGLPGDPSGPAIALPVRLWQLADVAEVHYARGGAGAVHRVVRERSGTQFDPALVRLLEENVDGVFGNLAPETTWDDLVRDQPAWGPPLPQAHFDHALEVVADWVDLKSPWFGGHSRAVADLAAEAGRRLGLPAADITPLRRAGLVHGLGRVGVPNTIWDHPGPLSEIQRERLRLHSYYTERMLVRPPALAEIGAIAALAHERLDGSGYHRGLPAAAIPPAGRVLAAAAMFATKLAERPHRAALSSRAAGDQLRAEATAGRLDGSAVEAVLAAAGQGGGSRPAGPAGLTAREVEVLVLIARGLTNRQAGAQLGISAKTVGNHVERIYAKAEVSTRAAATMFAMEHRLLGS